MRWAFVWCVKIIVISVLFSLLNAVSSYAWSASEYPSLDWQSTEMPTDMACEGVTQTIFVHGEGSIRACVMGQSTKVAMYYAASGSGIAAAISFPFDSQFYGFDACGGMWGCVYSDKTDTLMQYSWAANNGYAAEIYKSISLHLYSYINSNNGGIRYGLSSMADLRLEHPNGTLLPAEALASSENGQWLAVETKYYGVFLIEVETLHIRRVIAPGFSYSPGTYPAVELAVSNKGDMVAIMGSRVGISLVIVDQTCGDSPSYGMQTYYYGAVTPCGYVPIDLEAITPRLNWASYVKFSNLGDRLSFITSSFDGYYRKVTLTSNDRLALVRKYLALGDSFSSGEGETDDSWYIGGGDNACHVSRRSYPFLLGAVWKLDTKSVACSGSTIKNTILSNGEVNSPLSVLSDLNPQFVSVGIGGNDAGLMGKLNTCVAPGTCGWAASSSARAQTAREIGALYGTLRAFYDQVLARTDGKIFVVGYPQIISKQSVCLSGVGLLLDATEREFIYEGIRYLNQVMKAAALDSAVEYIDVEHAFTGVELCSLTGTSVMNGVRFGDDMSPIAALPTLSIIGAESFHPKSSGHELLSRVITATYVYPEDIQNCQGCASSLGLPQPNSYWSNSTTSTGPIQSFGGFIDQVTWRTKQALQLMLPKVSFMPHSEVRVEVHSTPITIGTYTADDQGGLLVDQMSVPSELENGYHTVHVYGTSFAGQLIDYYDFVAKGVEPIPATSEPATHSQNTTLSSTPNHLLANSIDRSDTPLSQANVRGFAVENTVPEVLSSPHSILEKIDKRLLPLVIAFAGLSFILLLIIVVLLIRHHIKIRRLLSG